MALAEAQPKPDLLLTDLALHECSGVELADMFLRKSPGTGVLVMVACPDGTLWSGIPYIEKPFTSQRLILRVQQVLAMDAEASANLRSQLHRSARLIQSSKDLISESQVAITELSETLRRLREQWAATGRSTR